VLPMNGGKHVTRKREPGLPLPSRATKCKLPWCRRKEGPHHVRVASWVKVLEAENPDWHERTVWPAIPIDAPAPVLPAAAMQPKSEWTAVALVHVARNGTATQVTITKPVADQAVNRALEDALRGWRFRAAFITSGPFTTRPNDSVIELTVKISVI
jgi:TonB family protein